MQKYKWIIWKHNAAMSVFNRVLVRLDRIREQIRSELSKSVLEVERKHAEIKAEEEAQAFLSSRLAQVEQHATKIQAILE